METERNSEIKGSKSHKKVTLMDFNVYLRFIPSLLDSLEKKINILPKVDEKGNSECSFAETLYAQKDKEAEKVETELEPLRDLLVLLKEELVKLRANLSTVLEDTRSLHFEDAKEKYLFARQGIEKNIEINLDKQKKLLALISQVEEMLSLARKKKWPLGKPKEHLQYPSIDWEMTRDFEPILSSDFPHHSELPHGREVGNLFSLGPIGRAMPPRTIE